MVNSEELIGTTEYLTLWTRCRINRFRYNRVLLYVYLWTSLIFSVPHTSPFFCSNMFVSLFAARCLPGCNDQHGHCNQPNECL